VVGGLIGSSIASSYGWRWTQWLNTILAGASLLTCFFFLPETLFDRDAAIAMDMTVEDISQLDAEKQTGSAKFNVDEREEVRVARAHVYHPYTLARSLKAGVYRGDVLKQFIGPWETLRLPAVWLVMLHYGGLVGGIVTISTVGPQFVAAPPYNWGANSGLINIGALIGCFVGGSCTFLISDKLLKRHAMRHSQGLSEPESRLPALSLGLFMATMGLLTFGFCGQYATSSAGWVGLQFGYGMLTSGVMQVPSIGFNYVRTSFSLFY
jgi:MFS family permease